MYANESKGQKFPPVQHQTVCTPCNGLIATPLCSAVYPEYVTDPAIYVCPSNSHHTAKDMYYDDGKPILGFLGEDGDDSYNNWWAASWSYMYFGFVYDQCDNSNDQTDASVIAALGINPPPGSTVPTQILQQWMKLYLENGMLAMTENRRGAYEPLENDTSGLDTYGNAGGDTVYRLREGIERFLVTDINNPSASAMAQSEIFVMWDSVSTEVKDFNHVPGGANVLYMDGHTEFVRYPSDKAPVTQSFALAAGAISS
jgi:prepilin-type processing-associated H-X9-DG protein